MNTRLHSTSVVMALILGSAFAFPTLAASPATSKAEAAQTTEDFSPQAQYKLSQKEAHAAYRMNVNDCKSMSGKEKTSCMKDAKTQLREDLASAKSQLSTGSSGSSGGSSRTSGTGFKSDTGK